MMFSIRAAGPDDIVAMHAVRLAVRENQLGATSGITPASYRPYVHDGSAWVAERDDVILGFAVGDEATASVWALFVTPTAEGTGVGRALHDAVLAWASGRRIAQLNLATGEGTRAEGFYRRMGWRAAGRDHHGQILFCRSSG